MYEVGVVDQFEAAHRLSGNFGAATRTHGHTYRVELIVRGHRLRDDGTLCDLSGLSSALQRAVADLHYQDLDTVPGLKGRNTTAEIVAEHLLEQVTNAIDPKQLETIALRLWESPAGFAGIEREFRAERA